MWVPSSFLESVSDSETSSPSSCVVSCLVSTLPVVAKFFSTQLFSGRSLSVFWSSSSLSLSLSNDMDSKSWLAERAVHSSSFSSSPLSVAASSTPSSPSSSLVLLFFDLWILCEIGEDNEVSPLFVAATLLSSSRQVVNIAVLLKFIPVGTGFDDASNSSTPALLSLPSLPGALSSPASVSSSPSFLSLVLCSTCTSLSSPLSSSSGGCVNNGGCVVGTVAEISSSARLLALATASPSSGSCGDEKSTCVISQSSPPSDSSLLLLPPSPRSWIVLISASPSSMWTCCCVSVSILFSPFVPARADEGVVTLEEDASSFFFTTLSLSPLRPSLLVSILLCVTVGAVTNDTGGPSLLSSSSSLSSSWSCSWFFWIIPSTSTAEGPTISNNDASPLPSFVSLLLLLVVVVLFFIIISLMTVLTSSWSISSSSSSSSVFSLSAMTTVSAWFLVSRILPWDLWVPSVVVVGFSSSSSWCWCCCGGRTCCRMDKVWIRWSRKASCVSFTVLSTATLLVTDEAGGGGGAAGVAPASSRERPASAVDLDGVVCGRAVVTCLVP